MATHEPTILSVAFENRWFEIMVAPFLGSSR